MAKTRSVRLMIILAILAFVLATFAVGATAIKAVFGRPAAAPAPTESDTVATVDGLPIPAKIYRMYLKNGVEALSLNTDSDEGRRLIDNLKQGIVSELIDRALIEAETRRRGLSISRDAFAEAFKRSVAQMGGEPAYRAYLIEHRLSDDEFRHTITQQLYAAALKQELDKEVGVTHQEIREVYRKQKDNQALAEIFKDPERVNARHILIAARRSQVAAEINSKWKAGSTEIEQRVSEEVARRRAVANSILARLKAGADFASLARRYSDDQGTKQNGGDLGLFTRYTHTARFDEAAFALRPGQLSGVIETDYGYHIIKVTRHLPERARTLDEVRSAIHAELLAGKQAAHLREWLDERRRQADIRIEPFHSAGLIIRAAEGARAPNIFLCPGRGESGRPEE
ncbi:MAG TPA: peptidylprolyl isomerase [Blastocatellia bacterium]|nr:peptidylprolyl isomerase [Blastocatellia bacterium]